MQVIPVWAEFNGDWNRRIDNATAHEAPRSRNSTTRWSPEESWHTFLSACFVRNYVTTRELEIERAPPKERRRALDDIEICEALF
jgi:hypothetical protein